MWKCKKCSEEVEDQFEVCWNCGSDKKGSIVLNFENEKIKDKEATPVRFEYSEYEDSENKSEIKDSTSKYPALMTIRILIQIFAFLIGIAFFIIGIKLLTDGQGGLIAGISFLFIGVLIVISLMALAEIIKVFVDIEFNTRNHSKRK